jgi:hypothetical protein
MPDEILSLEDEAAALWAGQWEPVPLAIVSREVSSQDPGQALPAALSSNQVSSALIMPMPKRQDRNLSA